MAFQCGYTAFYISVCCAHFSSTYTIYLFVGWWTILFLLFWFLWVCGHLCTSFFFCVCVCVQVLCMCVFVKLLQSCPTLCDPMDCSLSDPLSMWFSRQEYWSWLPWPPLGDLPKPGIEPLSLTLAVMAGILFTTSTTGEAPQVLYTHMF